MRRAPRTAVTAAAVVAGAGAFTGISALVASGRAEELEAAVARAVREVGAPAGTAMAAITHLGAWPFLSVVVAVMAARAALRRCWREAAVLVANGLVIALLNVLLKAWYARERPVLDPASPLVIALPESFSFPSGHAMGALGVYGAIAAVVARLVPGARTAVLAVTVLLVLAIGLSRISLGVHWPLDVLGGYAAAVPPLAVTLHLLPGRITRSR